MPCPATARAPVPREAPRRRRARGQRGPDRTAPGTDRAVGRGTGGRRTGETQTADPANPEAGAAEEMTADWDGTHRGPAGRLPAEPSFVDRVDRADRTGWVRPGSDGPDGCRGHFGCRASPGRPPRPAPADAGSRRGSRRIGPHDRHRLRHGRRRRGPRRRSQGPPPSRTRDAAGLPGNGEPLGAGELFDASGSGSPGLPGAEGTGPRVAFGLGGEPDFTPAGTLSTGQLAAFRSQGWTCPELRDLGFHLIWARAGVISGDEVLELRLTDGQHFATVLEQHASARGPRHGPRTRPGRRFTHQRADRPRRRGRRLHSGQGRHAVGRPRTRKRHALGQPGPALPGHLPDLRGHVHVHFGPAGRTGRRRRRRPHPGQQRHYRCRPHATEFRSGSSAD